MEKWQFFHEPCFLARFKKLNVNDLRHEKHKTPKPTCHNSIACFQISESPARGVSQFSLLSPRFKKDESLSWVDEKRMGRISLQTSGNCVCNQEGWIDLRREVKGNRQLFLTVLCAKEEVCVCNPHLQEGCLGSSHLGHFLLSSCSLRGPPWVLGLLVVAKSVHVRAKLPRFESCFHHFVAVWPHTDGLTAISLQRGAMPLCKLDSWMQRMCEILSLVSGALLRFF